MSARTILIGFICASACQTNPAPPPLLVTTGQANALDVVYDDVYARALTQRVARGGISKESIGDLIASHDERLRQVLNDEQFALFEATHRDYWIQEIYIKARSRSRQQSRSMPAISSDGVVSF